MQKKKILIITGRYLPGYKDGGPVRTIKNLVDHLHDEYEFRILTCDRDHGDTKSYDNIKINTWNKVDYAFVYYVPPKSFKIKTIVELALEVDLVYVCGCFSDYAINTLIANKLKKIKVPIVVAPMGLFSPNAFNIKIFKKKIFMLFFNFLGMFKNINWSATSSLEEKEINKHIIGRNKSIFIACDLPRKIENQIIEKDKRNNELKVIWLSRICEKKNLIGALSILKKVNVPIHFTIFGDIQDEKYWTKCKKKILELPKNIDVKYNGMIDSENVIDCFQKYHVFLFPTLGENYGHVIQEALLAGCPCIISDQTPWQSLEEKNAGYVFSLDDEKSFVETLEKFYKMDNEEFNKYVHASLLFAYEKAKESVLNNGYKKIFDTLMKEGVK